MPPLPKPKTGAAKGSTRPSSRARERSTGGGGSSSASTSGARSRTTKSSVTEQQLATMYRMVGTMLLPFGRFYPVMAPIGTNFRDLADEAAEAWMELAAKDSRVRDILDSLVGASTWGNVIGIHLAIFASALPGAGWMTQQTNQPTGVGSQPEDEITRQGRAMGLNDEEIAELRVQMMGQQMPARETSTGGPGDTVNAPSPPQYNGPASHSPSGIVSPEQLGVTVVGEDGTFPADISPPNGIG